MGRVSLRALLPGGAILALLLCGVARAELPAQIKLALASRDYDQATAWLEAHASEPEAAFELGKLYRLGAGVPKDPSRAATLFESAASQGHADAQYLMGKHRERLGELTEARRWMTLAAQSGHAKADRWLAQAGGHAARTTAAAQSFDAPPPEVLPEQMLSSRDDAGRTLLMAATENGATAWVRALLEAHVALDDQDRFGATALHGAISSRQAEIAGLLIAAGASTNLKTQEGTTPLHIAVATGQVGIASRLLSAGADVGASNGAGWSPRMLAERSEDAELRALFGVKPRTAGRPAAVAGDGDLPALIGESVRKGDVDLTAELLAADGARGLKLTGFLPLALGRGDVAMTRLLLERGAGAQQTDDGGRAPLMVAVDGDCAGCVALLIEHGADREVRNANGQTPLLRTLRRWNELAEGPAVAEQLLSNADELDARDGEGRSALWWACRQQAEAIALRLLDAGAVALPDGSGVTPLHLASEAGSKALVERLLVGANVDVRSASGNSPLLMAAHQDAVATVRLLVDAGADLEVRNKTGDTALIVAARDGHLATTRLLLKAGANPNTRNDRFESALMLIEARQTPEWIALGELTRKGLLGLFGNLKS